MYALNLLVTDQFDPSKYFSRFIIFRFPKISGAPIPFRSSKKYWTFKIPILRTNHWVSSATICSRPEKTSWRGRLTIEAILAVTKSQHLLQFLKDEIKNRNDLKTFNELASISAGESSHEIDRFSHFFQSVNAYAPLILDLDIKSCNFRQFMKACKEVFEAIKQDRSIPQKLFDSSVQNMPWIRACKDLHGSVEHSSLLLVSMINKTGRQLAISDLDTLFGHSCLMLRLLNLV